MTAPTNTPTSQPLTPHAPRPLVDDHTAFYLISAPAGFAHATVNLLRFMDAAASEGAPYGGALFLRPERAFNGQSGSAYVTLPTLRAYDDYLRSLTDRGEGLMMLDRFDAQITRVTGHQLPDHLVELGGSVTHADYYASVCTDASGPAWTENDVSDIIAVYLRDRHPSGWSAPRLRRMTRSPLRSGPANSRSQSQKSGNRTR